MRGVISLLAGLVLAVGGACSSKVTLDGGGGGTGGGGCPVDFTCGVNGSCTRKTCAIDSQCSRACVLGACYSGPGLCHGDTA
jgi:hypothetical protein